MEKKYHTLSAPKYMCIQYGCVSASRPLHCAHANAGSYMEVCSHIFWHECMVCAHVCVCMCLSLFLAVCGIGCALVQVDCRIFSIAYVRANVYNSIGDSFSRNALLFSTLSLFLSVSFSLCDEPNRQRQNTQSIQIKISNFRYVQSRVFNTTVYCLHLSWMRICIRDFIDGRFIDKIKKTKCKATTCAPQHKHTHTHIYIHTMCNYWILLVPNALQIISAIAVLLSISMIFIIWNSFQPKYSFLSKILIVILLKIVISPPTTA